MDKKQKTRFATEKTVKIGKKRLTREEKALTTEKLRWESLPSIH